MDASGAQAIRESLMNQNKSILRLEEMSKVFSKGTVDEVTALDNISLDVKDQDYITIIGSNGAGKSTMLNIIAGVYPPEKNGKVLIGERDVSRLSEYKHAEFIGRVYQDPNIGTAGKLTIEENLSLALLRGQRRGLRAAINKERRDLFVETLLPLGLGLENRLNTPVGTLSSGQRQAVALVMASLSKPALFLLDEHTANLDPRTAEIVLNLTDLIIEREKMTAMMVTHNMEMALKHGNRLIMMHKGRNVVDIGYKEKKNLTIKDLLNAFSRAAGEELKDDNILLSR